MNEDRFGWYGFSLKHPKDWAPTAIAGGRSEGYARLSSSSTLALQIRWKKHKGVFSAETWLANYFQKLETDAKRSRTGFRKETKPLSDFECEYRWVGQGQGRGSLFLDRDSGRVFFLEVTGDRTADLLGFSRSVRSSFIPAAEGKEVWAVFGMTVLLPTGLIVESKKFESGRTRLSFKHRLTKIECERWALGTQLIAKHGMEAWAKATLGWEKADVREEAYGLRLLAKGKLGQQAEAIVRLQPQRNQICVVRSSFRDAKWKPAWDWLVEFEA